MAALGCSFTSGIPVQVRYKSEFACKTPATGGLWGIRSVTESGSATTMQCDVFRGTSTASLIGQSTANVPSDTIIGQDSCYIHVEYTATGNGKTVTIEDRTFPNGRRFVQVVAPPTPTCTTGQTACTYNNMNVQTCSNNAWSTTQNCPVGCSNGACIGECAPNSIQCVGNANYKKCGSNGIYSPVIAINDGYCSNGQIIPNTPTQPVYKTCPDGTKVLESADCPSFCGDGKCDSNENIQSCIRDCAAPPPLPDTCPLYAPAPCPLGQHGVSVIGSDGCPVASCVPDIPNASQCLPLVQKGTTAPCDTDLLGIGIAIVVVLGGLYLWRRRI